ncbi:hypothetical protein [Herbaspirillum huttiense]|uniref:hypothetical protein n=1 Tax=Herbaspirillum huttiense TaxID=863372 RepID=UPI003F410AEE
MSTYQIGSCPAQGKDISRMPGRDPAFRATQVVYGRGYRPGDRVPIVATIAKPGKYLPHVGAKESAKFIANLEPEEVPCEGCGVYGEPNYAGGKRYCGSQYCCP